MDDRYQRGLASIVYKCFDKKSSSANISGGPVTRVRLHALSHRDRMRSR